VARDAGMDQDCADTVMECAFGYSACFFSLGVNYAISYCIGSIDYRGRVLAKILTRLS
jgi:hypothetical protein